MLTVSDGDDEQGLLELSLPGRTQQERLEDLLVQRSSERGEAYPASQRSLRLCGRCSECPNAETVWIDTYR